MFNIWGHKIIMKFLVKNNWLLPVLVFFSIRALSHFYPYIGYVIHLEWCSIYVICVNHADQFAVHINDLVQNFVCLSTYCVHNIMVSYVITEIMYLYTLMLSCVDLSQFLSLVHNNLKF